MGKDKRNSQAKVKHSGTAEIALLLPVGIMQVLDCKLDRCVAGVTAKWVRFFG